MWVRFSRLILFVEEIVNRGLIYLKKCVVVEVFITSCERGGIYHHEKKKSTIPFWKGEISSDVKPLDWHHTQWYVLFLSTHELTQPDSRFKALALCVTVIRLEMSFWVMWARMRTGWVGLFEDCESSESEVTFKKWLRDWSLLPFCKEQPSVLTFILWNKCWMCEKVS